ncbi:thiolase domain-containing protein [Candidatus Bathyarchaeota archaeon]|nr:thiolase domain-containing protein [Candidatus Bathyarchaeota archaeon]
MRDVTIIGVGMTPFGKHPDRSLIDLMLEASYTALMDADALDAPIDALYVGCMASGMLCGLQNTATLLADELGIKPQTAERIENSAASGASAILNAYLAVASGLYDVALVVGAEKMRHLPTSEATKAIASMTHPEGERPHGVTMPSLAALLTRLYMKRYGLTREQLALVAVKNHRNALLNPYAHLRKEITVEDVLNSRVVAEPLRLFDCSPISDGAAALLLAPMERALEFTDKPVVIRGVGQAVDRVMMTERDDLLTLKAVKEASRRALRRAALSIDDIDVVELHDAFTILEIVESEDLGLFEKGKGGIAVEEGLTAIEGERPINPSGGLKARGHPLGATGVAQAVEITWQLRGEAGERQVRDAERGLSCNISGFAANAVVIVYERGW